MVDLKRLPWDKKYLTVALHAAAAFAMIYAVKLVLDGLALVVAGFPVFFRGAFRVLGRVLAVFAPVIAGLVIAYLLDPAADFFQKRYERLTGRAGGDARRTAGTVLTYAVVVAVTGGAAVWLFVRFNLKGDFLASLTNLINSLRVNFTEAYAGFQIKLREMGLLRFASGYLEGVFDGMAALAGSAAQNAVNTLTQAGGALFTAFLGFVVAFFLLRDKRRILRNVSDTAEILLPAKAYRNAKTALRAVNRVLSGYIRGQLADAVLMAVLLTAWLFAVKVQFAALIGVFSGFANIIPYFGAFIGLALSVLDALISGEPLKALYAAAGVLVIQQIDAVYLNPRIVGRNVELGPVTVIAALSAAGALFGIGGMILAVPVCAVGKAALKWGLEAVRERKEMERERTDMRKPD
ncbi:MAG: AI-2E family transporter [Firmicutes bacterium]|nr:AI-2E family transporter [Bacillota bacterium]